ncbi:hypothetical protein PHYPSEUDO_014975 [Phytophthora pseudosyringae]|uniref:Uncharacterized protein n=1 Tax=Phytophthora pseudosyringae TaxID=221518 RepID=A0A8T1V6F4_9STRA|nr:hypothetical protein PHYPSEUDO_014975 [Phytophthora pseudosyringae]
MVEGLGTALAKPAVLKALKSSTVNSATTWFSATTSLVGARNKLTPRAQIDGLVRCSSWNRPFTPSQMIIRVLGEVEGDFEGREPYLNFFAPSVSRARRLELSSERQRVPVLATCILLSHRHLRTTCALSSG